MGQIVKIQVVAKFQVLSLLLITGMAFFPLYVSTGTDQYRRIRRVGTFSSGIRTQLHYRVVNIQINNIFQYFSRWWSSRSFDADGGARVFHRRRRRRHSHSHRPWLEGWVVVVSSQTRADSLRGRGNHEFENNVIDNLDDAGCCRHHCTRAGKKSDRAHETESNGRLIWNGNTKRYISFLAPRFFGRRCPCQARPGQDQHLPYVCHSSANKKTSRLIK